MSEDLERSQGFRPLLIAPQFDTPGPFAPGDRVGVTLPIHNLRAEDEHDVKVEFRAEGGTPEPGSVTIERIPAHSHANANTTVLIEGGDTTRTVAIYADLHLPQRDTLTTAKAHAIVRMHERLELHASCSGDLTTIHIRNESFTTANVIIRGEGVGLRPTEGTEWRLEEGGDAVVCAPFLLAPNEEREFTVPQRLRSVSAVTERGERTFAAVTTSAAIVPTLDPPELHVSYAETGIRSGDVLHFQIPLNNPSTSPVHDVMLTLKLPPSLELLPRSLAVDDVRVLPKHITVTGDTVMVNIGRLEEEKMTPVRGVLLSNVDRKESNESIAITGDLSAPNLPRYEIGAEIPVDREQAFGTTQTYLGELRPDGRAYAVNAVITNAESTPIERIRIRWQLAGLLPLEVRDDEGRELGLQTGSFNGKPCLITELQPIDPLEQRIVTMRVAPTLAMETHRRVGIQAALHVDSTSIRLGTSVLEIAAQPDLTNCAILCEFDSIRSGIPRIATLKIHNTGASAAEQVRLALTLPDGVVIEGLPEPQDGTRWILLTSLLPPGSKMERSFLIKLEEHPLGSSMVINATIDAKNVPPVDLTPLTLATPAAPMIQQPELTLYPLESGLLRVSAKIVNMGDAAAYDVLLKIPPDDHGDVVAGTTTIDGVTQDDRGVKSPLVVGLIVGTLPAGRERTVEWIVAPDSLSPYRATLIIEAKTAEHEALSKLIAQSPPRAPRPYARLATALPEARRIDINDQVRAPDRSSARAEEPAQRSNVDDLVSERSESALRSSDAPALESGVATAEPAVAAPQEPGGGLAGSNGHTNGATAFHEPAAPENATIAAGDGLGGSTNEDATATVDLGTAAPAASAPAEPEPEPAIDAESTPRAPETSLEAQDAGALASTTEAEEAEATIDLEAAPRVKQLAVLSALAASGEGGLLPHLLAARIFVADTIPLLQESLAPRLTEIHEATDLLCRKYDKYQLLTSRPDKRWLIQLDAMDAQILPAAVACIADLYAGQTELPTDADALDASLSLLHATRVVARGASTNTRLAEYGVALSQRFSEHNHDVARESRILGERDEELDRLLDDLLAHL
jgi:hypothetical protein